MGKGRRLRQRRGWAYATAITLIRPPLLALTSRDWRDGDKIPATGGCVIAVNHVSHLDPITLAHFLLHQGRLARYLAKEALFHTPFIGAVVRNAKQIPVRRMSATAVTAFDAAVQAVHDGECVVVYVEGTITRDPDGWPMRGKTGAARIGLATGCPVIPVGQWGAQDILPAYTARPHLFPRRTTAYKVGDPVDLEDLRGKPPTNEVLHEATDRIMAAITAQVAELRGEEPPAERFDPKKHGVPEVGNFRKDERRRTS
ncbi:lysophospholipid acyltransferase family protein [Nocardioides terrisoli]|uniref:lysophospholipid acyltransferase family protein n=1 Tax=Nocardioides terrisoli TaxID=3388267 RepID=UPI00287B87E6|nr:lysophospholipid acyltransferase family protein [Nocardioides marmorisolisilvae]